MPQCFTPRERDPGTHGIGRWAPEPVWMMWRNKNNPSVVKHVASYYITALFWSYKVYLRIHVIIILGWNVTLCTPTDIHLHCSRTYCLHLLGQRLLIYFLTWKIDVMQFSNSDEFLPDYMALCSIIISVRKSKYRYRY
jgi:hypothetical protein